MTVRQVKTLEKRLKEIDDNFHIKSFNSKLPTGRLIDIMSSVNDVMYILHTTSDYMEALYFIAGIREGVTFQRKQQWHKDVPCGMQINDDED